MTRDDFEKLLDETPDDWDLRLVYSDWLEEHGDELLACAQRWLVRHKKHPKSLLPEHKWREDKVLTTGFVSDVYQRSYGKFGYYFRTAVPYPIFATLLGCATQHGDWKGYPDRRKAELALSLALRAVEVRAKT